jgi:hypothetical protein
MQQEIEYLIQQILIHEMALPANYGTQEGKIIPCCYVVAPNVYTGYTDNLQIGVQSMNSKIIGNTKWAETKIINNKEVYQEHTQQVINDDIQIDIFSRNDEARQRRYEILSALTSFYSQQQQEKYQFKIYNIPHRLINTSRAEGGATIYRYTITVSTQYSKEWTREIDYFETFPTQITEQGTYNNIDNFTISKQN